MSSNGLLNFAKRGRCRLCNAVRKVDKLRVVGEVRHGYATGHVWECLDAEKCVEKQIRGMK